MLQIVVGTQYNIYYAYIYWIYKKLDDKLFKLCYSGYSHIIAIISNSHMGGKLHAINVNYI